MGEAAQTRTLDNQFLLDLFNASPIGIAVENFEGQPLFVNPALCSMLGFSEEELRSKRCVRFSPHEDTEKDWTLFQQLRAGSIDHYQQAKRFFRRDGSLVWGRLSICLLNRESPLIVAMVETITDHERSEEEVRQNEARLAAEADALAKLNDWSARLWQMSSLQEGLSEMLVAVIGLLGADKANVQLLDSERGVLNIVAQYGFEQPFLDYFREVSIADHSACGRSLRSGRQVVVEDIETDAAYAPLRAIARTSGYRSVISTPLVSGAGSVLGMLSTHFGSPHRPTEESLLRLGLYAHQAAGFVQYCKAKRAMSERYAAIVESSEDAIISKNLDRVITSWNAGAPRIFGYPQEEAVGQPIAILIPPELRDEENKILEKLRAGERIEHYETIRVTKTGQKVNVSLCIFPIKDLTGKIVGFSKIARDITERKRAEEALASMTRKLIEAQEQERARIGRELHDDVSQRLAMLSLELEQLQDNPADEVKSRVREVRGQLNEISSDVQALSHDLHSSKLDYLGVVAGIKSWCKEFAERQGMGIDFNSDVQCAVPHEIGLALFRVLQEALHNVIKHSGVRRVDVHLRQSSSGIQMVVGDLGRGFDLDAALQGKGLGLTSMQERVRLVNGTISIDSKPMGGTTIQVRVPI